MSIFLRNSLARLVSGIQYVVKRELVNDGSILVKPGESVLADQVIAQCEMPGHQDIFRLARVLGVSTGRVQRYLRKKQGEPVKVGEMIAMRGGLGNKRIFRSPVDGTIENIDAKHGEIVLRRPPVDYSLEAGFDGIVAEVRTPREVYIQITADVFTGVLGMGERCVAEIDIITDSNEDLEERHIDGGSCDRIIVTGGNISYPVIKRAMAMGVRGIIAAGIPARDYQEYTSRELQGEFTQSEGKTLTMIITSGFGHHTMQLEFMEFFHSLRGQLVVMDRIHGTQVTGLIVPLGSAKSTHLPSQSFRKDVVKLKKQQRVRIIAGARYGFSGRVVAGKLMQGDQLLGEQAEFVKVRLDSGEEHAVPRWNVEVID
ncbi:MAG TPA: hypothetical protein PKL83_03815 [bacterium]|nr:hypothetical protein [bacterium]